jgi:hypothetical protein
MRDRQYSFLQLTQLTIVNQALGRLASHINDSLATVAVLLPFSCEGRFTTELMFFTHENTELGSIPLHR